MSVREINIIIRRSSNIFNNILFAAYILVGLLNESDWREFVCQLFIVSLFIELIFVLIDKRNNNLGKLIYLPNLFNRIDKKVRIIMVLFGVGAFVYHYLNNHFTTSFYNALTDSILPLFFALFLREVMSTRVSLDAVYLPGLIPKCIRLNDIQHIHFNNGILTFNTSKKQHQVKGQLGESIIKLDEFFVENKIKHIKTTY